MNNNTTSETKSKQNSLIDSIKKHFKWQWIIAALGVLLLMVIFNYFSNGIFFSQRNITLLLRQAAILGVLSGGMVMVIVTGNIDLSAGSAIYLITVVVAQLTVKYNWKPAPTIIAAVVVGILMGAFQGMMVAQFNVPSFIVTLAGMLIFRGIGYVWTNALTVGPVPREIVFLSEGFIPPTITTILIAVVTLLAVILYIRNAVELKEWESFNRKIITTVIPLITVGVIAIWVFSGYNGMPMAIIFLVIIATITNYIMSRTKFGRNLYVVGGNAEAAMLSGIKVKQHVFSAFIYMGVIYAIAGILTSGRLASAPPTAGEQLDTDGIAAAVIGGTSLAGGVGSIPGALVGALLLAAIDNYMSLMNISSFIQQVVKGLVLLGAVWFDSAVRKNKK